MSSFESQVGKVKRYLTIGGFTISFPFWNDCAGVLKYANHFKPLNSYVGCYLNELSILLIEIPLFSDTNKMMRIKKMRDKKVVKENLFIKYF